MKEPIRKRELLFGRMRRTGQLYPLDWNLVDTELGGMLEPRQVLGPDPGKIVVADVEFNSVDRITEINEDQMQDIFCGGGYQLPRDFNAPI